MILTYIYKKKKIRYVFKNVKKKVVFGDKNSYLFCDDKKNGF